MWQHSGQCRLQQFMQPMPTPPSIEAARAFYGHDLTQAHGNDFALHSTHWVFGKCQTTTQDVHRYSRPNA